MDKAEFVHRHPYFALWLHGDDELGPLAGGAIVERVTLHEWPLSCVQRLTLADGRKLIYKTQYGPTVEPEVYACVQSDLLPWAETVYRAAGHAGRHACMLIEYVDAPTLEDLHPSEEDAVRVGREMQGRIAEIDQVSASPAGALLFQAGAFSSGRTSLQVRFQPLVRGLLPMGVSRSTNDRRNIGQGQGAWRRPGRDRPVG